MSLPNKWRLNGPLAQNVVMGVVLFCLPGIYLALTGLGAGGGGPSALQVAIETNAILYGLFAVFGWVGGVILNIVKPRVAVIVGGVGYPLYVGSLWYFDRQGHRWFPYFAGTVLGFTASCLWTAAGYIAWTYPEEKDKGKFIALQWGMTSLGGTVGGAIAFGVSVNRTAVTGVSSGVYIAFIAIMCFAMVVAGLLLKHPAEILRDDGTHLAEFKPTNMHREFKNFVTIIFDWKILVLTPAFFAAEMCLSIVSSLNSYYFNLRTRSLNNMLFQFIMIVASVCLSLLLDFDKLSRRKRGIIGIGIVSVITIGACSGLIGWMTVYGLDGRLPEPPAVDWTDPRFAGGVCLYLLWGIVFSTYLVGASWVVASLSNDPVKVAFYSGFTKGTASLGLCICFIMDSQQVTYMRQAIAMFVIYTVGSVSLLYVIIYHMKDSDYFLEEDVVVPVHVLQEKGKVVESIDDVERVEEVEGANDRKNSS